MFGRLIKIVGNQILVQLENEPDMYRLTKYADGKQPYVEIGINDGRNITVLQRRKIYAMFGDIANWSGYSPDETKQVMKNEFVIKTGYPEFSLARVSESVATKFIDYLITFCLHWEVPFKFRTWDMIRDAYYAQYQALLTRHCVICGQHADIDHITPVGIGRNRQHVDNMQFYFQALCRKHHTERHKLGINTFMQKYHTKPIKLTADEIKKLNIGGYEND